MTNPTVKELDEKIVVFSKKERKEEVSQEALENHFKSLEFLKINTISELKQKLERNVNNIPIMISHHYPKVKNSFSAGLSLFYLYQVLVVQFDYAEHAKEYLAVMKFGICGQDIDKLYNILKNLSKSFK